MSEHVIDLLDELRTLGVNVGVERGNLKLRAPQGILSPDLLSRLNVHKNELIRALSENAYLQVEQGLPRSYPLSFSQERMWFSRQLNPNSAAYNMPVVVRIEGQLDLTALQNAMTAIVQRHAALRVNIKLSEGMLRQVVKNDLESCIEVIDCNNEDEPSIEQLLLKNICAPFDLENGVPFRSMLLRLSQTEHILSVTLHHIVTDRWSMGILLQELCALYTGYSSGNDCYLEPLASDYFDYVNAERDLVAEQNNTEQMKYWTSELSGAIGTAGLPKHQIDQLVTGDDYRGAKESFTIPTELANKLRSFCRSQGYTLFMVLLAAFASLLYRYSADEDVLVACPITTRRDSKYEQLIGLFMNTVILRNKFSPDMKTFELLKDVSTSLLNAISNSDIPFEQVVNGIDVGSHVHHNLQRNMFVMHNTPIGTLDIPGLQITDIEIDKGVVPNELTMTVQDDSQFIHVNIDYAIELFDKPTIERMCSHFCILLEGIIDNPEELISKLPMLSGEEVQTITKDWNCNEGDVPSDFCVHTLIEKQVEQNPDRVAVVFEDKTMSYTQLNELSNRLAHKLIKMGIGPEMLVGVYMDRSLEMMVGLLGILKAGAAYVPLDPQYPSERLAFMVEDSELSMILTQTKLMSHISGVTTTPVTCVDEKWENLQDEMNTNPTVEVQSNNLMYVIYTSGSTGQPKGVQIQHNNVVNLFYGVQKNVDCGTTDVVLAMTSMSFDISVLELFWPLSRGARIVLLSNRDLSWDLDEYSNPSLSERGSVDFSLFFFADANDNNSELDLLLAGARFADENGFHAIWTPERHFDSFGGLFPNPSLTSALLAGITKRIKLRAGSVVLPLHHEARVAEEWSFVDHISGGRVGVAFASGWNTRDFVLSPLNYHDRKKKMLQAIESIQRLWAGDEVSFLGVDGNSENIRLYPQPVQARLPIWITSGGSEETFVKAGELGANILTHFMQQDIPQLEHKIRLYRDSLKRSGFPPESGKVTLMVHTFVGTDGENIRETVKGPLRKYLASSINMLASHQEANKVNSNLRSSDLESVLDYAFERYYENNALFGTVYNLVDKINKLVSIGVDEFACLVDFGLDNEKVLEGLRNLNMLKKTYSGAKPHPVLDAIIRHKVTIVQCTPSWLRILSSSKSFPKTDSVKTWMLGGEALTSDLADQLKRNTSSDCKIFNMYGPTETTIWSTCYQVSETKERYSIVPIGKPLLNTYIYVLNQRGEVQPIGAAGEIYIGGKGVSRGYRHSSNQKFVENPFRPGEYFYRTGDIGRFRQDGKIEFLSRVDDQVKLNGYRVELAEVESIIRHYDGVREAACVIQARNDSSDAELVAFVIGQASVSETDVRRYISQKLPHYMIPAKIFTVDSLPRTTNGKLDRKTLATANLPIRLGTSREPETELEKHLCELLSEVLRVPEVKVDDNFFDLGGNSITAAILMTRVREEYLLDLELRRLFDNPTVTGLADMINECYQSYDDGMLAEMLDEMEQNS